MLRSRLSAITALVAIITPVSLSHAFAGSGSTDGGNVTWSSDDTNVLTLPTGVTGAGIDSSGVAGTSFGNGVTKSYNDSGNSQSFFGVSGNTGTVSTSASETYYYNNSLGHATINHLPGMFLRSTATSNRTITDTINFQTAQSYFGVVEAEYTNSFYLTNSNISFYSGSTLLASMPMSSVYAAQASGGGNFFSDATLNVDFLNGVTYNQIVVSVQSASTTANLLLMNMTDGVSTIAPTQPGVAVINASSTSLGQGHVGAGATGVVSVTNSTPDTTNNPGGMVDVSSDKTVNSSGGSINTTAITGVQITGLNSANVGATLNLSHDGANSGSATVSYVNDQTNHGGVVSGTTQTVATTVTATGYNYAAPSTLPSTLNLGATRVSGTTLTGSTSLGNNATNDGYSENLNASISGLTGSLSSTTPTVSGIAAGSASDLNFSLSTGTSGTYSQTATVALTSDGTGVDSLGTTALTSKNIIVSGYVYQTAAASLGSTLSLGNTHIGGTLSGNIGVQNTATGGLVDTLVASSTGTTGAATAGINTLNLASNASGNIVAGLSTTTAGAQSGTVAIGLTSHDSQLSDVSLGSQNVTVTGGVYNYAASNLSSSQALNLGAARVGGSALSGDLNVQNTSTTGGYSENLNTATSSLTGPFSTSTPSVTGIAAGSSGNLHFGMSTGTSGSFTDAASVAQTSNGTGIDGLGTTSLGTSTVNLSGNIYQTAAASIGSTINLGNTHVGGTLSGNIGVTNSATGSLVDNLVASATGTSLGVTAGANTLSLVSGGNGGINASLAATTAGGQYGTVTLGLTSHDSQLSDLSLGSQTVTVTGNAYNYAATNLASTQSFNLGATRVGGAALGGSLNVQNTAAPGSYSENLDTATSSLTGPFSTTTSSVTGIAAGSSGNLQFGMSTGTSGTFTDAVSIAKSSDGTGLDGLGTTSLGSSTVNLSGTVYQTATVSLPTTISLGNAHVGGTLSGNIGVTNSATGSAVDSLVASATGTSSGVTAGTNTLGLASGGSGNITAGLSTATAGAQSGTVTLGLASHDSQLSDLSLGNQNVAVTGGVYNYAASNLASSQSLNLGAARVGGTALASTFNVQNTAATGGYSENLDTATSSLTGPFSTSTSSLTGVGAGSAGTLHFGMSTGTSGTFTDAVSVAKTSNGTGIDGLGTTSLGTSTINLSGNIYQVAAASLSTTLNLGNTHIGGTLSGSINVANTATGGLVDSLLAYATGTTGGVIAGANSLSLGSGINGNIGASFSTATAGVLSGTMTLGLTSHDGQLSDLSLGNQTITVIGDVYNIASTNISNGSTQTVNMGATRVGGSALTGTLNVQNTAAAGVYSEGIDLSQGSLSGTGITAGGNVTNLAAGSSTNLTYGIASTTSGSFSQTTSLGLNSDGATTSGLGTTSIGSSTLKLMGNVYQLASGVVNTSLINFGIVHLGQNIESGISATNTASGALVDALVTTGNGGTNGFSTVSSSNITAGNTNTSALMAVANTATLGVNSGTVTVNLASHDNQLSDVSLGTQAVAVTDTVYAYADATIAQVSGDGTFVDPPSYYTLDFGNVDAGVTASSTLELLNSMGSNASQLYTDLLSGNFEVLSGSGFELYGPSSVSGLAGGTGVDFTVDFETWRVRQGSYTEVIEFNGTSTDAGGSSALDPIYLTLRGTKVPEASGIFTMLAGLLGLTMFTRRRKALI
jgi:hypothetical protein